MRTKIYRQREYIGDLLSLEDRAELIEQAHREAHESNVMHLYILGVRKDGKTLKQSPYRLHKSS